MMYRALLLTVVLVFVAACGPSQKDYDNLKSETASLKEQVESLSSQIKAKDKEIDDLINGAGHLLAQAKNTDSDAGKVKVLDSLISRHPESLEAKEAASLLKDVQARIAAAEQKKKQEEDRKREEAKLAAERALRNMKKDTDQIKNITWISHKNEPLRAKYLALYFGSKDGRVSSYPLRLKIHYYSDDWLFVDSVTIKADDHVFELRGLDFERDNGSRSIWEWSDSPVKDHAMINKIIEANKVVVRFNGRQYYSDLTVSKNMQQQMREVRDTWLSMGGKP